MIIYFSGTGNSKYVANMLAHHLDDQLINASKLIKKESGGKYQSDRPFIFVSPTYAWQLPHIFTQFIKESLFIGSKKAYFIMTCGSDIGYAESSIRTLCEECHLDYQGVAQIVMPENYIAMYPVPTKEEADKIIAHAIPSIKKCIHIIKEEAPLPPNKVTITDKIKSNLVNPLFYSLFVSAKKFKTNNKCNSCGKCVTVCPLANITLKDGQPVWGDNCTHCMACICDCPTEAIEYGKKSVGKPRYHCKKYESPIVQNKI